MSNYIYLLQEREFITTKQKVYKLGKTKQENLQRFKQYPKGSKLLLQQVCDDCDILEVELIREFKNKHKHRRDIGNEYFEGDYKEMIKDIHNKITNDVVHNEDTDDEENKSQIEIDDEVKVLFPNYCDDESFGGTKKLIKTYIEIDKIIIKYIDCEINDWNYTTIHNYMVKEEEAYRDEFDNTYFKYKDNYYDNLIKYKAIENDKIYDLNDSKFVKKLDKYKHSVQLHYSDKLEFITDKYRLHSNCKYSLIEFHMQNNAILNDDIYCSLYENDSCHIYFVSKDWFENENNHNTIVDIKMNIKTINGFGFDYEYLKRYSPYCINLYNSGEYYMLNRDYKIITHEDERYADGKYKQLHLHRGNETPCAYNKEIEIKILYNKLLAKLKETTTNKICKNENKHTNIILTKCI
jgi:hypothetical protein